MARRMRRNGGQWKVLLFRKVTRGSYLSLSEYQWYSYNLDDCYVTPAESFDDAVRAAFSIIEGDRFTSAYVLRPDGIPAAVIHGSDDAMVLTRLGAPVRDRYAAGWGDMALALKGNQYTYVRSRGGWDTDGPTEVEPHRFMIQMDTSPRSAADAPVLWPDVVITLVLEPYSRAVGGGYREWVPVTDADFKMRWDARSRGAFAEHIPEDQ